MEATLPISASEEAARPWADFVRRLVEERSGASDALRRAIDADPGWAVGRGAAALLGSLFGHTGFDGAREVAAAAAGTARHDWERSFVHAAVGTVTGGRWSALPSWEAHHDTHPADVLGLATLLSLLSYGAYPDWEARAEPRVRRTLAVAAADPYLLGTLGLLRVDRGDLDEGRRLAERALDLDPGGYPGGHPLAHVFFESGDHAAGADWIDDWLPDTDTTSDFHGHLVWHSALHRLHLGEGEAALERYRRCGAADAGGRLFDGPSLLWRCQLGGLVPTATDPVHPSSAAAVAGLLGEPDTLFVGVHVALALATGGDAEALRRYAARARGFDVPGGADLLPDLATGLAHFAEGDHDRAVTSLRRIEDRIARIGGSHAQREVVDDTLIEALIRAGRLTEAAERLAARLDRRESPLDRARLTRTKPPPP